MSEYQIDNKGIDNLFDDEPKRKTRAKKPVVVNPAQSFLDAVTFVSHAQKKTGEPSHTHCAISGGYVCASNGELTIAAKVEENISIAPNTFKLIAALKQVVNDVAITKLSDLSLAITSGNFKAIIPCYDTSEIFGMSAPDEPIAVVNNDLILAIGDVIGLANETAAEPLFAGIMIQKNTVVATNGAVIFEAWHGIDLPPAKVIPKSAAKALVKCKKNLVKLGFSDSSITFWFDDDSFIKTQLYKFVYPQYEQTMQTDKDYEEIPSTFFDALKTIAPFVEGNKVVFKNGMIVTDYREENASTYKIDSLPEGIMFNHKYLLMLKPVATNFTFDDNPAKLYFYGPRTRGAVMGLSKGDLHKDKAESQAMEIDDDIPF